LEQRWNACHASEAAGVQDSNKASDAWFTGAGYRTVLARRFLRQGRRSDCSGTTEMKGEFEALEKVSIEKNCNLRMQGKR
jgi:hypothetical protein